MTGKASPSPTYAASFAAVQVATALLGNKHERAMRNINQGLLDKQAQARNRVTAARNMAAGAQASLSSFIQSVNNQRMLDAGAKRQSAALGALSLGREIASANSNDRRQAASRAAGEAAASAVFQGTVGGAPQRLQAALALRTARQDQRAEAEAGRNSFYLGDQAGDALADATAGLDNRSILPNRDESIATAEQLPFVDSPAQALLKSDADFSALIKGTASLTNYLRQQFTSPQGAPAGPRSPVPEFDMSGLTLETP